MGIKMKRVKTRTKHIVLVILSVEIIFVVAVLAYIQLRPVVVKAVILEAGAQMVDVEEFLRYKSHEGDYITDISTLNLNEPGIYPVKLRVGNAIHTSSLQVIDTISPTATIVNPIVLKGEPIEATSFVKDVIDATNVNIIFKEEPDVTLPGIYEVTILMGDTSDNWTELQVNVTVLDVNSSVNIEAKARMNITIDDYVDTNKYDAVLETDLTTLDISRPTSYDVQINMEGKLVTSKLEVIDTTAPTATISNQEIWNDGTIQASSFVTNIIDVSNVSVYFNEAPNFILVGEQSITIVLEDESGNKTEQKALLTVKEDTEAPTFNGVKDKTVYIGDTVSYKKNVTITDNKDLDVEFQVDSSNVNLTKVGTYQVTYTATDAAGNIGTKNITITVKEFLISEEDLNELADSILDRIITDRMTQKEQAYEIFLYVKSHIGYTGHSDKSDWMMEAYRGITNGFGDCFTYYAVSEALLSRVGIDNMRVTRVGGETQHFWNLINCGDGWYHFDSCPHKDHLDSFMLTDAEVEEYTEIRGKNYYNFDQSLYPATPEN